MLGEEYKLWSSSLCSFLQSPVTSSLFGPTNVVRTPVLAVLSILWGTKFHTHTKPQATW
jgi:hypothetical protein